MLGRLMPGGIALRWHPGDSLFSVRTHPPQVNRMVTNICLNARDAIVGTGAIAVETRDPNVGRGCRGHRPGFRGDEFVKLSISDTGSGVDKEAMERAFEPFFTTKEPGQGTGLGLAIAHGIVKENGGFMDVRSEPGQGTTITIRLRGEANSERRGSGVSRPECVSDARAPILGV